MNAVIDKERDYHYLELMARIGGRKKDRAKKQEERPELMWEKWEEQNDSWLEENYRDHDLDLDDRNELIYETAEPSSDMIVPLFRYQKEWLFWALNQEESEAKGGILADEMGMGKTIQAIALVLAKRELKKDSSIFSSSPSTSQKLPLVKGTLVICPVVAVQQWINEINRCTIEGSNKILIYLDSNKINHNIEEYDFVVTTYSIVEAEYRPRQSNHQHSKNSKPQIEMLDQKTKSTEKLSEDVSRRKSVLHFVKWDCIILDEAQYIKDAHCNTARAILALESSYKWALIGIPLQNHIGELYSYVRFLQVTPYTYYLCKDCDCRALDYR